jgi:hypothetical protein
MQENICCISTKQVNLFLNTRKEEQLAKIHYTDQKFFSYFYSGGAVQLGPLGTAATNRPIVPALCDYDDGEIGGMMIGRGSRSSRRKPAPVSLCPPKPDMLPGCEPWPPRWEASD